MQNFSVFFILSAFVPQPQSADDAPLAELTAAAGGPDDIVPGIDAVVALEAVEGDAELVEIFSLPQDRQHFFQQCAVGSQADPEAQFGGNGQDFRQLRVQQRLAHHMEIEVAGVAHQLFRQMTKFFRGQKPPLALRAGAEAARQVADIGDFQINPFQHGFAPFRFSHCTISPALCKEKRMCSSRTHPSSVVGRESGTQLLAVLLCGAGEVPR